MNQVAHTRKVSNASQEVIEQSKRYLRSMDQEQDELVTTEAYNRRR